MYRPWGFFPVSGALPLAPQVCPARSVQFGGAFVSRVPLWLSEFCLLCRSARPFRRLEGYGPSPLPILRASASPRPGYLALADDSKGAFSVSLGGFRRFASCAAGLPGPFVVSRATGHRPWRFFAPRCRHVPDALSSQAIQGDEDSVFLVPRRFSAPCLSRRNPFPAFPGRYEDYVFCPCAFSVRPVSLCFITGFPQADRPAFFAALRPQRR